MLSLISAPTTCGFRRPRHAQALLAVPALEVVLWTPEGAAAVVPSGEGPEKRRAAMLDQHHVQLIVDRKCPRHAVAASGSSSSKLVLVHVENCP